MKKLILLLTIISLTFIACKEEKTKNTTKETTKKEAVKPEKNTDVIIWKGYKPTGTHNGTINVKTADFIFEGDKLVSGEVTFDMNSIKCLDIKDVKYNSDLVNHLKSKDFFDATTNPLSIFAINNVKTDENGNLKIEGKLTLNGVTKEISFPAKIHTKDGHKTLISDVIKIDRTDFGVKYKSKKFFDNLKDKFINDEFDITFKIALK